MKADQVTTNLLMYCYHCENAYRCETEEKCKDCWANDQFVTKQETRELTTEELLREYAH